MKEKVKVLLQKIGAKLDIVAHKLHLSRKQLLIIMGASVALIVIVLCLLFGNQRVPKDALVLIDANKKNSITEAGFQADGWNKKRTRFSAKWEIDEKANIEIQNFPKDISERNTLVFRVKLDSTDEARIMFYFGSENKETEEADYYCLTTVLEPGKWNDVEFDMSKLVAYGQPLGLDKLTEISIRTKGWRNSAEEGSIIRFGHMYLIGEPVKLKAYNTGTDLNDIYPHFTQDAINDAAELAVSPTGWPRFDEGEGLDNHLNGYPAEKCTNALYYLTLAVRYNEMDEKAEPLYASNGVLCKDAVIQLLEFFLQGGNEPAASPGCFWGHAVMANSLYLIKNTECIYNELSQDTKDRMDWMMKALAVAGNWGYNDANNYSTGLDLCGNFGKSWNMNYQNTYLSVMLTASMYFGNAELDEILVNFDYDTYMNQFREYNFINVIYTWETAGKTLMETGVMADGSNPVLEDTYAGTTDGSQVGDAGGSGKGVKIPFKYTAVMPDGTKKLLTLQDEDFAYQMFVYLASKTYSQKVVSSVGNKGQEDYSYIYGDVIGTEVDKETQVEYDVYNERISPYEGRVGMFSELNAKDTSGFRSSLTYAYDSFEILTGVYTNMKLFGGWDSSTEEMQALDEQIYVGNEDMLFRMEYGYYGYSSGSGAEQNEQTYAYRGIWYVKDIWKNVICDWEANTAIKGEVAVPDLPDAQPMGGVITPPEGALSAQSLYANMFVDEAYTSIGKMTTGTVAFDMVIGNDVPTDGAEEYDTVIAIMSKGQKETWNNMEMSFQLQNQLVNIRSGSSYARTGFYFEANYRFHAEITFDAKAREYSVKIQQIYPSVGEVYECKDVPFRSSGDIMGYVDSIAVLRANKTSDLWLENVYVNGRLIAGTDVKYADKSATNPTDDVAPDTLLRVHRDVWREFTDYTKINEIFYAKRETVVLMAKDELSDLGSVSYYVSSKPLSESVVKSVASWVKAEHDVACFKIEPYTKYYVYVKSVDSEGNVGYVSKCIMLDPDIPQLSGVTNGKTYCEAQTLKVSDRYLSSVTINGEEIIHKLSANGTYTLEKNSGKLYITVKDRAGNARNIAVRLSDEVLTNKNIIDSEDATSITKAGLTVDEDVTYKDGTYAARWDVQSGNVKFKGAEGDLTDYKTLKFAVKVVPGDNTKNCSFLMFFGSENNAQDKLQYYQKLITVGADKWYEFSIDLSDFTRTRSPKWQDIQNVRIYANNWGDTTNVEKGSKIYIGYMYLVAGEEDRVHAENHTFSWVPSEIDTTRHDYMYSCCNTVTKSEPHVKATDSDKCSVCGQNMNTVLMISSGSKEWNTLLTENSATAFTNNKKVYIRAKDYGFGIKKLEYATSDSYVGTKDMGTLKWSAVKSGYSLEMSQKDKGLYIYARVTDNNGKVTYVSTGPLIYDSVAPVIKGVEAGVTYCEPPTITVTEKYLNKVTVGGATVTLTDGKYTFEDNCGTKEVVVTDKAGNKTSMTITVSDKLQAEKVIMSKYTLSVDSTYLEDYFVKKENSQGIDVSNYKQLSFRMLVSPKTGTTATTVRVRMALWSHTFYEWTVKVTPGKWQTVSLDLHNPDSVSGSMKLSNVRFFTFIALGGDADVQAGSIVKLENVCLKETRVHGDTSDRAYVVNVKDSSKHDITYACCNTVVKTEKHTYGTDRKCIYCTAPELSGIKHGTTYCYAPTITVKDNNKLDYLKVNGKEVTLDDGNKYTLPNENGEYVIEVRDEYNNVTTSTVKVLSTALGNEQIIFNGFTYDFGPTAEGHDGLRKTLKSSNLGMLLTSYKTLKFNVNVTSNTLAAGTQVDLRIRLYIDGGTYYIYHQKVTVGKDNQVTFNLETWEKTKGDPTGFSKVQSIMFEGEWDKSQLRECKIVTTDITLTGLSEVRQHTYNQEIMDEAHRVDMNEVANCINGFDYYKSCVCGAIGTEIFEGPKGENHASAELTYKVNEENTKQHIKTTACCGEVIAVEGHDCASNTVAGVTVKCDYCGTEFVDNLDNTAPVISGIQDGKTYYDEYPTMIVTDDVKLDKVTVNGVELAKLNDGSVKYQFATYAKAYKIVAVDDSGNQETYTIKVWATDTKLNTDFENSALGYPTKPDWDEWSTFVTGSSKLGERAYPQVVEQDGNKLLKLSSKSGNSSIARVHKYIDVSEINDLVVQFDYKTNDAKQDSNTTDDLRKKLYVLHCTDNRNQLHSASTLAGKTSFWTGRNTSDEWQTIKLELKVTAASGGKRTVTGTAYALVNGSWTAVDGYNNVAIETGTDGILKLNFITYVTNSSSYALVDNVEIYNVISSAKKIAPSIIGIHNGATYLDVEMPTMCIMDSDLEKVTINNQDYEVTEENVLPVFNYKFTEAGNYNIVAKDNEGNETTYMIAIQGVGTILSTDFTNSSLGWPAQPDWDEWSTFVSGSNKLGQRAYPRIVDLDGNRLLKMTSKNNNSSIARVHKYIDVSEIDNLVVQFDFKTSDTKQGSDATDDLRKKLYVLHCTTARNQLNAASTLADMTSFWTGRNTSNEWQTVKLVLKVTAGEDGARVVTGTAYALIDGTWTIVDGYSNVAITTGTDGILKLNFITYVTNNSSYALIDNVEMYTY